jgi:hypothetical protein
MYKYDDLSKDAGRKIWEQFIERADTSQGEVKIIQPHYAESALQIHKRRLRRRERLRKGESNTSFCNRLN